MMQKKKKLIPFVVAALTALVLAPPPTAGADDKKPALTYTVPDTGQDRCFGGFDEIVYPGEGAAYAGQDAQHRTRGPRYEDGGDGAIHDLVTGLVWQKTPDFEKRNQDASESYAAGLELAGHSDWRLPTLKELFSIADLRGNMHTRTPYIDTKVFDFEYPQGTHGEGGAPGSRDIDAQYATSTRYLGITMGRDESAFGFNFADGRIKSYPLRATRYVRCVRGNPDYGENRFRDNRDGTITDAATGLTWQKADAGKTMDWKAALAHAESLELAGHSDWRLPNVKELQSIVDYSRAPDATDKARRGTAIDAVFTLSDPESWCWSSTTHIETGGAYYVCFGQSFSTRKQNGKRINAHGAGAVRSDPKEGDPVRFSDGMGPQSDEVRILNHVLCVRGGDVTLRTDGPPLGVSPGAPGRASAGPGAGGPGMRGGGAGGAGGERGGPAGGTSRFIGRLDKDGDGKVSRDEFDGPSRRFPRLDKNGDGFIDADEAPQGPPGDRRKQRGGPPRRGEEAPASDDETRTEGALEVITVGTGSPLYNADRSSPATLVRFGKIHVLVDMGEGTFQQLTDASISLQSIAAFCFTHHHRDHDADAMTILPKAWLRSTTAPVVGPAGTRALVEFLWEFFAEDFEYRLGNRGSSRAEIGAPHVIELPHEGALDIAGLRVTTAPVKHTITTFAYRFDAGEQSIVVSGDLAYSESLIELAKGADVLVMDSGGVVYTESARKHERGSRARSRNGGTARGESGGRDRAGHTPAHASIEEIARMAAAANVRHLVLTHFRPGTVDEEATLSRIRPTFSGSVHFAADMQTFTAR